MDTVRLLINADKDYVTLGYIANDADERLNQIQIAINDEKAAEEKQNMENNENNVDGL